MDMLSLLIEAKLVVQHMQGVNGRVDVFCERMISQAFKNSSTHRRKHGSAQAVKTPASKISNLSLLSLRQ